MAKAQNEWIQDFSVITSALPFDQSEGKHKDVSERIEKNADGLMNSLFKK